MFNNASALKYHYNYHESRYTCTKCQRKFKTIVDYICHMHTHGPEKMYKCPECPFRHSRLTELESHLYATHNEYKKYKCQKCGKRFSFYTEYDEHKQLHLTKLLETTKSYDKLKNYSSECSHCGEKFPTVRLMREHIRKERTLLQTVKCKVCDKKFIKKERLLRHMREHVKITELECLFCDKTFEIENTRKMHERVHLDDSRFRCLKCKKVFLFYGPYWEHIRLYHIDTKDTVCFTCGKDFQRMQHLKAHESVCPAKVTPTTCDHCKAECSSLWYKQEHIRVQHSDSLVDCKLCQTKFANTDYLISHLKDHYNSSFKCQQCDRGFKTPNGLENHKCEQSSLDPFECAYCDQKFELRSALRGHIRNRVGNRPHVCEICNKNYSSICSLKYHLKNCRKRNAAQLKKNKTIIVESN